MLGALVLLSPWGALVSVVAIVPVLAVALAAGRSARAARALGLAAPSPWPAALAAGLAAAGVALLGLAAAQPALETTQRRSIRGESQVLFVVDVSRSMLASSAAGAPTRLDRAQEVVRRLRAEVGDVPAGIAGMTDRVLPYLFPTVDPAAFDLTLRSSVLPDAPPPGEQNTVATTFDALSQLVGTGYFAPGAKQRACVLVTDGETRSGADAADGFVVETGTAFASVGADLGGERGCRLLVVRVGGPGDRIRLPGGRIEGQYRPDAAAPGTVRALADASDGWAFSGGELAEAGSALRSVVSTGPTTAVEAGRTLHRLAPWLALAGALALVVLVAIRARRPESARLQLFEYTVGRTHREGGHR